MGFSLSQRALISIVMGSLTSVGLFYGLRDNLESWLSGEDHAYETWDLDSVGFYDRSLRLIGESKSEWRSALNRYYAYDEFFDGKGWLLIRGFDAVEDKGGNEKDEWLKSWCKSNLNNVSERKRAKTWCLNHKNVKERIEEIVRIPTMVKDVFTHKEFDELQKDKDVSSLDKEWLLNRHRESRKELGDEEAKIAVMEDWCSLRTSMTFINQDFRFILTLAKHCLMDSPKFHYLED